MRTTFEVLEIRVSTMGENNRRHVLKSVEEHSEYIKDLTTLNKIWEYPGKYANPLYYNEESGRWEYKGHHIIIENIRNPEAMEELMCNHNHARRISLAAYLCEPLEEDRIIPFDVRIRIELANVFYKHDTHSEDINREIQEVSGRNAPGVYSSIELSTHSEEKIGEVSQGTTHKLDFPDDEYVTGSEESTFLLQRSLDVLRDVIEHRVQDPDKLKALHYDITKYLNGE